LEAGSSRVEEQEGETAHRHGCSEKPSSYELTESPTFTASSGGYPDDNGTYEKAERGRSDRLGNVEVENEA
jgi:hypothetical protein